MSQTQEEMFTDPALPERPQFKAFYRVNGTRYEYNAYEIGSAVAELAHLGVPVIHVQWEMRDEADAPVEQTVESPIASAFADIRSKYAAHPEVIADFETVLANVLPQ